MARFKPLESVFDKIDAHKKAFYGFNPVFALKNVSMWRKYFLLAFAGLAAGSIYIGIGLWAFSHFFISFLGSNWGIVLGLSAALWTFVSEIPFLIIVVPIVVKACHQAFPELLSGNSDVEAG